MEDKFGKKSELLERERNLDTSHIEQIKNLFWEMHFLRKPSKEIEPFDPVRIESHIRLSGKVMTAWEYSLIMDMDLTFRATIIQKRN